MRYTALIAIALFVAWGCAPDNRCGDDLVLMGDVCIIPSTDTDSETDTDQNPDGGDTDETSGIGEPCTADGDECADHDADYCASQPGADEGYCTYDECASDQLICPDPYQCCDMGSFSFCASESDYESLSGLGMCGG